MQFLSKLAVAALSGLAFMTQAHAGYRTWVSNTGTDSGTCLVTAPCRTFQYAHDQTQAGGEVDVKDSGGYGLLTINRPITIVAPDGVLATIGIPSAGGNGIVVNTGPNDVVTLRGLTINGYAIASTTYGVWVKKGSVTLDHLNIFGAGEAIQVDSTTKTFVTNCLMSGNTQGIVVTSTGILYLSANLFTNTPAALAYIGSGSSANILSYSNDEATSGTVGIQVNHLTPF